jgi:hypothetical protein
MVKRLSTRLSAAALLVGLGGLVACVDAGKSFDDFTDRVGTTDANTVDRPPSSIHNVTGTFLLSVHAGFETSNDPAYYVQLIANWTLADGDQPMLDGSFTPLCVSSACTVMRDPIPPALTNVAPVMADGTFSQALVGALPGGANPFSGTMQAMNGALQGVILDENTVCGTVIGTVAGLDLAGSTFGAIRVTDTTPANLPPPVANCPN